MPYSESYPADGSAICAYAPLGANPPAVKILGQGCYRSEFKVTRKDVRTASASSVRTTSFFLTLA